MSADPPDVDFVVADDPAGADEDLPEPIGSPWWLRARVPLGVAAAVVLLAAMLFRVASSGPGSGGRRPVAAPGSGRPVSSEPAGRPEQSFVLRFPRHGVDVVRIPPPGLDAEPPCDILPMCVVTEGAPDAVLAAISDYLPHAHVVFASTSSDRTGIAGRHERFRSASVLARRGPVTIRLTVSRLTRHEHGPTRAGEQETAFGTRLYARAYLHGFFVSIDVTAPNGRAPAHVGNLLALATDARLRPAG